MDGVRSPAVTATGTTCGWHRTGDVRSDVPLARPVRGCCTVTGCGRGAHSAGLCRSHHTRLQRYGDPGRGGPLRGRGAGGSLSHGYWWVPVPEHLRHLVPPGRRADVEHRLVMAGLLGRPLRSDEVVHHRDGDRLDNRPADLELWTTAQPEGQRVEDQLAFARDLLSRYDVRAQVALGLGPPPDAGRPATGSR